MVFPTNALIMHKSLGISELVDILIDKGVLKPEDLTSSVEKLIPISIFTTSLSPLEAMVRYLIENILVPEKNVSKILGKNTSTIKTAYKNSSKKKFDFRKSNHFIPLNEFEKNCDLSILEIVVSYLKKQEFGITQIGNIIERDPRTIWTIAKRAETKLGGKND